MRRRLRTMIPACPNVHRCFYLYICFYNCFIFACRRSSHRHTAETLAIPAPAMRWVGHRGPSAPPHPSYSNSGAAPATGTAPRIQPAHAAEHLSQPRSCAPVPTSNRRCRERSALCTYRSGRRQWNRSSPADAWSGTRRYPPCCGSQCPGRPGARSTSRGG